MLNLFRKYTRKFWKDSKGVAIIEFAIISIPFFYVLMGTIEISLLFFYKLDLERAFGDQQRKIFVQDSGTTGISRADFQTAVCNDSFLPECADRLVVQVNTIANWSSTSGFAVDPALSCQEGANVTGATFTIGTSDQIMVGSACYRWTFFTPMIGTLMSNVETGNGAGKDFLMITTSVWENE